MHSNNTLGSSSPDVPMPDNYTGGDQDFSLIRQLDGQSPYGIGEQKANAHYPNADYRPNTGVDEDGLDCCY